MAKSNFDDLGVFRKLVTWATTFILGVWGHVMEQMVEKLDFSQKLGVSQNPALLRGQKFKDMALEKNFVPTGASDWP
jgi:hypothetical protein